MARSPDLQPLLIKAAVVLVVLLALGYAGKSWYDQQQLAKKVDELVQEAADLQELHNDTSGARAKLQEALKLDPDHWKAHDQMGLLLRELSRPGEALLAFERAIEGAPDDELPAIYLRLGKCHREQLRATNKKGHYNNARMAFGQAEASGELAAQAIYLTAMLEIEARKALGSEEACLRRALAALERLAKEHPDFDEIDVEERAETLRGLIERAVEQREGRSG